MRLKIKDLKFIIGLLLVTGIFSYVGAFKVSYYTFVDALWDIQKGRTNLAIEKLELTIRLDKTAIEAYKQLLYLYLTKGNTVKVKTISSYLLENVDDIETLSFVGNLLLDYGYLDDSKKFFDKVRLVSEKNKDLSKKDLEIKLSSVTKESSTLKQEYFSEDIEEMFRLGLMKYKMGKINDAIDIFRKVVSLSEDNSTAKLLLADLLSFTTGHIDEAKNIYMSHLATDKEDYDTMLKLVILLLAINDIDSAEKYVKILESLPEKNFSSEMVYYIAIFYELKKDFVTAARFMEEYFKLTKSPPLNPYLKIGYYYSMIKKFSDSEKYLISAIRRFNSFEAKIILVFVYMEQKKFDKCIKILKDIEKSLPIYDKVYFYLGYCYDQKGRFDIAEKYFLESISKYPDDHESMNYLGYSYAEKNIKLNEAEYYINKALKLDPENVAYLDSLAWVYYKLGKYKEAEEIFDKISLQTSDVIILEHIAEVKEKLGKKDEALIYYKKILELDPKNSKIKRKLKTIKEK
ncbi:MAG: tetratricopeptide repeat protein [Endomicrobiia bacterium]